MGHILWEAFYWPGGAVLGNLIASVIWASPTFFWLHRKHVHLEEKLSSIHAKLGHHGDEQLGS